MLQFFRKHQKYFFIFITVIIVASFSFFGSYQAFTPTFFKQGSDEVIFYTVEGKPIKRSHLNQMIQFLEREDWMQMPKILDGNYLNDGVISKEFLEGGLAVPLFARFGEECREELTAKLNKEREHHPYRHPYLHSLGAEQIWSLFAPEIPKRLDDLKKFEDPIKAFETKVALFLAEKSFPPAFLTHIIRYQEREQLKSVPPDSRLIRDVVSLFGYHHLSDWFTEKFVEQMAVSVIQMAALAHQKGYVVSREEALTELLSKSQKTYHELSQQGEIPVASGGELLQVYLRQKGLDEATLISLWQEISLFRRMMQDIGSAALVDTLALEQFHSYAAEQATVELYQMAPEFRFKNEEERGLFAAYLEAVSPSGATEIPLKLASLESVEKKAPQLVGKKYRVALAALKREALHAKVSLKETWDWELSHWDEIQKVFPELAQKEGSPFERLEQIANRKRVDAYARDQIIQEHPEWIEEAIQEASLTEREIFVAKGGDQEPLPGIRDKAAFEKSLDDQDDLACYTQDQKNYYRVCVRERLPKEILPFKEAKSVLKPSGLAAEISFVPYLERYRTQAPPGSPWTIEKKELPITRSKPTFISLEEVLELEQGAFSLVAVDEKEGPYCYKLKEVLVDTTIPLAKWQEVQNLLAKEMKQEFFESLLDHSFRTTDR